MRIGFTQSQISRTFAVLAALSLAGFLACSGEDRQEAADAMESAGEKMSEAAGGAAQSAEEAAAAAKAAAEDAAAKAQATAEDAAAAAKDAVTADDPVKECIALAGKMAWDQALEPCQAAAADKPDDLQIRHALQQAEAAAASAVN